MAVTQRCTKKARRGTKGLFWNADYTDLAETRGFSTALKIYGLPLIFWPLRGHFVFAVALSRLSSVSLGVTPMISALKFAFGSFRTPHCARSNETI